ncbi:NepR family anti-sigma factor [Alteraurantiacibacter buctensis]
MEPKGRPGGNGRKPEWAQGLKKLYDSVVEEPLPDDLTALLARLDDEGKK